MSTRAATFMLAGMLALLAAGTDSTNARSESFPEFVEVPAGPFVMGADPSRDPDAFSNERWSSSAGEGTVDLAAFYISRHEITVAQYAAFAGEGKWSVDQRALSGPANHPVTFVAWPDALAYCRWLESRFKVDSTLPRVQELLRAGWRVTLPNEAQWEKAARGGDRRRYPWGNEMLTGRANVGGSGTTPVGSFPCPECPYGLLDLSGNVWEWTRSAYQPYPFDASNARVDLSADALWVMRGGHYGDPVRMVRTTTRGAADPGARRPFIGFRVVIAKGN